MQDWMFQRPERWMTRQALYMVWALKTSDSGMQLGPFSAAWKLAKSLFDSGFCSWCWWLSCVAFAAEDQNQSSWTSPRSQNAVAATSLGHEMLILAPAEDPFEKPHWPWKLPRTLKTNQEFAHETLQLDQNNFQLWESQLDAQLKWTIK